MLKRSNIIILVLILSFGCTNQDLDKRKYYEKGLDLIDSGNTNGAVVAFKKAIELDQSYFEARYQLALAYNNQSKFESAEKELLKVLRLNPSLEAAHLSLAKAYVNMDRSDDAIKEINLYLAKHDDNPEAYETASAAFAARKDYSKAEEMIMEAIRVSPERTSSKIILAEIYQESGDTARAEKVIHDILDTDKRNYEALFLLTRIKQQQGKTDDAIDSYRRILEIKPGDVTAMFELGLSYIKGNKLGEAEKIAKDLMQKEKNRPEGDYLMGLVHFQKRETDEAIISLQKSLTNASILGAYYYLGLSHLSKGDLEQATSAFQKAVDLRPDLVQAHLLLAVTHLRKGRAAEAEREVREVLKKDDKNAFAHNLLGSVYLAQGKGDLAMEEFDKAIDLNPGLVDAHIKKGAFSLLSGDTKKAEREFINAVEVAPDVVNSRIILAQYYIKNKKYEEAIKILNEGLKENPDDAILYNIIGAAYLGAEKMDNAVKFFEKAVASNTGFFLPYYNLALVYLNKGEEEKALAEYRKVLSLDQNNVPAMLMMAKILEERGKDEEALSYYTKAREQDKPIAYLALAGFHHRKNQSGKAHEVLQKAMASDPDNINILDMEGGIYLADKDYKKALETYGKLASLSQETGTERMVSVYTASGDYDNAIKKLRELLSMKVDKTGVLQYMVNIYLAKKDNGAAERTAKEIISTAPKSETGYQSLAEVYMAENQFQKAIDILKTAQELNQKNIKTKLTMIKAYISAKDTQSALALADKLEKSYPDYAPVYFMHASILELTGQKEAAVLKHKKALALSPNYVASLNNLAFLFAEGYGPIDKAIDMAQKAKVLTPRDGRITDTLGWTMYAAGRYEDAAKKFIEATHYLPGEPTIRYHLGLAYLKTGRNDKAEEQLKNAIRLGRRDGFPELQEAQAALEGIIKK